MGLSIFGGHSSCACKEPSAPAQPTNNPNPRRFNIFKSQQIRDYLVAKINYPDATNFEGNKILVFYKVTEKELRKQTVLDPHFYENSHLSPIARFIPTDSGWFYAVDFCRTYFHSWKK